MRVHQRKTGRGEELPRCRAGNQGLYFHFSLTLKTLKQTLAALCIENYNKNKKS